MTGSLHIGLAALGAAIGVGLAAADQILQHRKILLRILV